MPICSFTQTHIAYAAVAVLQQHIIKCIRLFPYVPTHSYADTPTPKHEYEKPPIIYPTL